MLVHLSLAECGLTHTDMPHLPNLRSLDLSDNLLPSLGHADLEKLTNLRVLSLAGNPLTQVTMTQLHEAQTIPWLLSLDVSRIPSPELNVHLVYMFPNLETLNMSGNGVDRMQGEGFQFLGQLRVLDLRGCPMTEFPRDVFMGLDQLHTVFADNYKLCCPDTLPTGFNVVNCYAPADEISSCNALLRSDFYRVLLSVFAALSLLGNVGSFVYRTIIDKTTGSHGFGVFVTHLCLADSLMGVYLAVIGVADRLEVSAFIICLITLDRFLVLRSLSAISTLRGARQESASHCQSRGNDFAGHTYSFSVVIILNFVLFLMIAAGQGFIYWSIRTNSVALSDTT
nr:hypothetical protein BaRGS_011223 [Batillaria attramentaria]